MTEPRPNVWLDMPIAALELSTRAFRGLTIEAGYRTIRDIPLDRKKLMKINNLGKLSVNEIMAAIAPIKPPSEVIVAGPTHPWWDKHRHMIEAALAAGAQVKITIEAMG